MTTVNLPKKISGKTLESACLDAAREMGYKVKSEDVLEKEYSFDSVMNNYDTKKYRETKIRVGRLFPAFQIYVKKGEENNYFFIWTGFPFGFASEKKVREYLGLVLKYSERALYSHNLTVR